MSGFPLVLMKWVERSTSEQKKEEKKNTDSRIGKNITNTQIIIYVILAYNFSDLNPISCFIFFIFTSCHLLGRMSSPRSLAAGKSVRLSAHLRFLASANQALPSLH